MTELRTDWGVVELADDTFVDHYRIVSTIGSGGMGKVYKAVDTRLDRPVALKVLRPELLRDQDKVRRFRQEAKAASSLNHGAIVTVLDVGEMKRRDDVGESIHYIVMEYIDGESLRQKLRQRLPLQKRLELIARIAEGMAAAHAAGVVHRDLKPDNIIITAEGQPKIVDFGLAKLTQPDLLSAGDDPDSETVTFEASRDGVVMGTVGYMSPEQVEGRQVDHRTDIFALGCILYEAVTGQRAFAGDSTVATLHKILYERPAPPRKHNPSLAVGIEHIIDRCLAKDPEERYQSIKEVAIELRMADSAAETSPPRDRRWRRWATAAAAAAVAAVATSVALLLQPSSELSRYRFTPLATDAAYEGFPAWSPDGRAIAYVRDVDGILQLFVRSLDSPMATQITRAARDCREPFWHPSGDRILYISQAGDGDALWSVGTGGGSPEVILSDVSSADISPDGKTLVLLRQTLGHGNLGATVWTSSPPGAEPRLYSRGELNEQTLAVPGTVRFSPDGKKIGLWAAHHPAVAELRSRDGQTGFWILPYPEGEPYSARVGAGAEALSFRFAWMHDGRHVLFGGELPQSEGSHLWLMDTVEGTIRPLTAGHGSETDPAIAPDGRRIAFSSERGDYDLVAVDLASGKLEPYVATTRLERSPASSIARSEIAYVTNRSGREEVWLRSFDGAWERPVASEKDFGGDATLLLANLSFSPDGQRVAYQRRSTYGYQVWISPIAGGPAVAPVAGRYQDSPTWSPDGNWMAFVTTHGGLFVLLKIRIGGGSRPELVKEGIVYPSTPQWSPRGDWITIETPAGLAITSPDGAATRVLLEETVVAHTWARDGSAIYAVRLSGDLHLILSSIEIDTGVERQIADLGLSPPVIDPIAGLTLTTDGTKLVMGMRRLEGDLWQLEGFSQPRRLFSTGR